MNASGSIPWRSGNLDIVCLRLTLHLFDGFIDGHLTPLDALQDLRRAEWGSRRLGSWWGGQPGDRVFLVGTRGVGFRARDSGACGPIKSTGEAATPSVSMDRLPDTLLRRTAVPPPWIWVTLIPCPMRLVVAGKDERMLPLTVRSSALQCVSAGTSMRTFPDTEPNW